jgi:hypothetical protein
MQPSPASTTSCPLGPNILLCTLFLYTLNLCSSFRVRDQLSVWQTNIGNHYIKKYEMWSADIQQTGLHTQCKHFLQTWTLHRNEILSLYPTFRAEVRGASYHKLWQISWSSWVRSVSLWFLKRILIIPVCVEVSFIWTSKLLCFTYGTYKWIEVTKLTLGPHHAENFRVWH